ncbi:hypothetical protein [Cereibacter changlensis]|uniref:hypothetical protein n=1 Tax=Cereibacter changlensis TaxID=402884 RepID=UPI0011B1ECFC|nr:hypothetical protein [Cereibacter changlensis]
MNYKAGSQAILAIINELDCDIYEMERHGEPRRTVSKELYERVKLTLLQVSSHLEDLADGEERHISQSS